MTKSLPTKDELGLSDSGIRPRLKFFSDLSPGELKEKLKAGLKDASLNNWGLQYRSAGHHLLIAFPRKHRHFWSPALDISFERTAEGQTLVRMLMGPEPAIWTMFVFFYTVGGLAVVLGLVLGYSQYSLGHGAQMLYLIPGGLVLIGLLYLGALGGKSRAAGQMRQLTDFVKNCLSSLE